MSKYLSAKYYQDYKEKLQKENVSLSKQEKKRQYGLEQNKNLFEGENQELIKYRKENYKIWK